MQKIIGFKMAVIEVKNLSKNYDGFTAVDSVSFAIQEGEIVGLLGPNGAGKTTTINMILGILEPMRGEINVFGKNIKTHRTEIAEKTNFAAVYAHMPFNLTVLQNLKVFGHLYGVKNLKNRIEELLKEFDLEKFKDQKAGVLSSGELSRLNLAKAIINDPKLILLDEPTASLDPSVAKQVREIVKSYVLKNNAAVLWTSHNMREIEEVCDRVMFLSKGKIVLSGNPKTLAKEYKKKDLEELFITIAREPLTIKADEI
jgi:ABC-2 type transport system ATP-binding protein